MAQPKRTNEQPKRTRRTNLTGRAAVLALVVCVLAISLAYPLREWLSQRQEISGLQKQVAEQQRRVETLRSQQKQWQDPAFVRAQARERLHYVMPGETAYVVLGPKAAPRWSPSPAPTSTVLPDPSRPWYTQLWQSTQAADTE